MEGRVVEVKESWRGRRGRRGEGAEGGMVREALTYKHRARNGCDTSCSVTLHSTHLCIHMQRRIQSHFAIAHSQHHTPTLHT